MLPWSEGVPKIDREVIVSALCANSGATDSASRCLEASRSAGVEDAERSARETIIVHRDSVRTEEDTTMTMTTKTTYYCFLATSRGGRGGPVGWFLEFDFRFLSVKHLIRGWLTVGSNQFVRRWHWSAINIIGKGNKTSTFRRRVH